MMPGETGLEFLTDIREDNAVPALFLTAMSDAENRIEGLEAGADDYIPKPFEPRELVLRIKRILQRHRTSNPKHQRDCIRAFPLQPKYRHAVKIGRANSYHYSRATTAYQLWQTAKPDSITR